MFSTVRRALSAALVLLAGCSSHSLTGTYATKDPSGAAFLQLTQGQQLLGSLTIVALRPDGELETHGASIVGGTTDGASFTLTLRSNEPLASPTNATGRVVAGGIDLTIGTDTKHLSPATPEAFNGVVRDLAAVGKEQQGREKVAQLTKDLTAYCEKYETRPASGKQVHDEEERLLAAARHDLKMERGLNSKSFQASQVRFRIGQLAFQLGQIDLQARRAASDAIDDIGGLDLRLAQSPCATSSHLAGCDQLTRTQQRYAPLRTDILSVANQVKAETTQNVAAMTALTKEAGH